MREILGRRRRLLSKWNFGLRSGGNDERSGGTGSVRAGQASSTDGTSGSGKSSRTGKTGKASKNGTASGSGAAEQTSETGVADTVDGVFDELDATGRTAAGTEADPADGGRRAGRFSKGGRLRGGTTRGSRGSRGSRGKKDRPETLGAALTFATEWQWPVLPGVGLQQRAVGLQPRGAARCACPDAECTVPGAHPFDPGLLAATTDERMLRWWWANRPTAPIVMATGGRAPCAVSLPAVAAARALAALDRQEIRLGPVLATFTRWSILVAPYTMEQLGDLLYAKDYVPGSLRFHGEGGYVALPPSRTGQGPVRWEREPLPGSAAPWVPDVEAVVDAVVDALTHRGVSAPEL